MFLHVCPSLDSKYIIVERQPLARDKQEKGERRKEKFCRLTSAAHCGAHVLFDVPPNNLIEVLVDLEPEGDCPRIVDRRRPADHHALDSFVALPPNSSCHVGPGDAL